MFFPPPADGDVPRYVYMGELIGEQNFVYPEDKKPNRFVTVLRWLAGLFDNPDPIELQRPQAGVVDERGRILITDVGHGSVYVFDESGGQLDVWEKAEGFRHFISPVGISLGPPGKVFVADSGLRRVVLLDQDGNGSTIVGPEQLERPTGVAWDSRAGLLYVSDTQAHQIKIFSLAGQLIRTIGRRGEKPGEFNFPTHIVLRDGKLVVSDTMNARVQVISLDHNISPVVIGRRGLHVGDLVRPKGVATDSEGNIYVIESYYDHLLVFDREGRFLLPIGGTGKSMGQFYLPGGVWTDGRNRVYVADTFNGRVEIFQFLGGDGESE